MNADEVIRILNELCNKLGIAIDWSAENVMPYFEQAVTQLATAKTHIHLGILILCVIVFCIGIGLCIPEIINSIKEDVFPCIDYDNGPGFGILLMVISVIVGIIAYILWTEWRDMPTIMAIKWFMMVLGGN